VARPPYEQLVREIEELGYLAVGRKYGVSDNAIRKWRRAYEAERTSAEAVSAASDAGRLPSDHAASTTTTTAASARR
jgi:transposase-like protein